MQEGAPTCKMQPLWISKNPCIEKVDQVRGWRRRFLEIMAKNPNHSWPILIYKKSLIDFHLENDFSVVVTEIDICVVNRIRNAMVC